MDERAHLAVWKDPRKLDVLQKLLVSSQSHAGRTDVRVRDKRYPAIRHYRGLLDQRC